MKYITTLIALLILCFANVQAQKILKPKWSTPQVGSVWHFHPSGTRLLTYGKKHIDMWDITTDTLLYSFTNDSYLTDVQYNYTRDRIAVVSSNDIVYIINSDNGEIIHELSYEFRSFKQIAFSKNNDLLLALTDGGVVCIWNIQTGVLVSKIISSSSQISRGSFSSNGSYVLLQTNGKAEMYDTYTGEFVRIFYHTGEMLVAGFFNNDERILTLTRGSGIKIWNVDSATVINVINNIPEATYAEISEDGKYFLYIADNRNIIIKDASTYEKVSVLTDDDITRDGGILSAHFNKSGEDIISTSYNGTAKLWQVKTGGLRHTFQLPSNHYAEHSEFDRTGKRFLTSSSMGVVTIWDTEEKKRTFEHYGYCQDPNGYFSSHSFPQFSPSDEHIITGADDRSLKVWNAETGAIKLFDYRFSHYYNSRDEYFCSNNTFISGSAKRNTRIRDANSLDIVYDIPDVSSNPNFLPSCKQLIYLNEYRNGINIYDLDLDSVVKTIRHNKILKSGIIPSPTGDITIAFGDSTLYLVSLQNDQHVDSVKLPSKYFSFIEFVEDNTVLIKTKSPDKLIWINTELGEIVREIILELQGESYAELAKDKSRVIITDETKTMRMWDSKSGVFLREISLQINVDYVDFDKNWKYMLTVGYDTVSIYDFVTMERVALAVSESPFTSADFNNKTTQFVTAEEDGTVRVWDTHFLAHNTGVNEYSNVQNLTISPNPTTDEITIKGISTNSLITYTFTDILGTVITHGTIPEQTDTYTLSTRNLPSGFYNVTFQMNGTKHTEKLTVVH